MLHQLVDYAQSRNLIAEEGFTRKNIRWLINFDGNGNYLSISAIGTDGKKSKGELFDMVPHLKFSGSSELRQFLVDSAQYTLLYEQSDPNEKLLAKHSFFISLLYEAGETEPILKKIADTLSNQKVRKEICSDLAQQSPKAKSTDNVTFAVIKDGLADKIFQKTTWHDWWKNKFPTLLKSRENIPPMRCFVTGKKVQPCATHPKIKMLGDVGGNSETTLVGFNPKSFRSYGLKQSSNATFDSNAAQQYAAALNYLIENNSARLAGTKVIYWYDSEDVPDVMPALLDPALLFDNYDEHEETDQIEQNKKPDKRTILQKESQVKTLLDAVKSGNKTKIPDAQFYAMTVAGNSGRVVVLDWMEGKFEELVNNINQWFTDLTITERDGQGQISNFSFKSLLAAQVRDLKDIAKPLERKLFRAAVKNEPLPDETLPKTLLRIRADILTDTAPRHSRYGLLKAYLNRKEGSFKMNAQLDPDLDKPAYHCGRILAVLANIQREAMPEVGSGIVQKYYASASATPGLVLGRLVRMAQVGHLPSKEIEEPLKVDFEKQLSEIWTTLKSSPPKTLDMEGQTLFAMGYYQQKAYRKTEDEANTNV